MNIAWLVTILKNLYNKIRHNKVKKDTVINKKNKNKYRNLHNKVKKEKFVNYYYTISYYRCPQWRSITCRIRLHRWGS